MIVEAVQLSDLDGDFEFYYDEKYTYRGQCSHSLSTKDILLHQNQEVRIWARHKYSTPVNYIPFINWLGVTRTKHKFVVYDELIPIATITHQLKSFKQRFKIELTNSDIFYVYAYQENDFYYLSVYKNIYKQEQQIALIERMVGVNCKYKLYLPDEFSDLSNVLSIFMLYFQNHLTSFKPYFIITPRGFSVGTRPDYTFYRYRSFCNSKAAQTYDPTWRERNFPSENFFGPINIDKDTKI